MMTVDEVESLSEAQCKAILGFLAKQAYGERTEICINKGTKFKCTVMLKINGLEYYPLGYVEDVLSTSFGEIFSFDDFKWRNLLKKLADFVQKPNAYVSYLYTKPHLIDNSVSIEETLINAELKDCN